MHFPKALAGVVVIVTLSFFSPVQISPVRMVAASSETDNTDPPIQLDRDLSDCLNSNPKPNCGHKPTQAGDRGGWLQYLTFAIIIAGLVVIFTVIFRNVLKVDKEKEQNIKDNEPGYF